MKIFLTLILLFDFIYSQTEKRLLPFSRIKMIDDNIYFTLGKTDSEWKKLLSIKSIGSDAIVKFSKDHYGINNCDYSIECYRYNVIVNFDKVFTLMNNYELGKNVELEYEHNEDIQTGIDVECTFDKFKTNAENIELNIKQSKGEILIKFDYLVPLKKGINNLKKRFQSAIGSFLEPTQKSNLI